MTRAGIILLALLAATGARADGGYVHYNEKNLCPDPYSLCPLPDGSYLIPWKWTGPMHQDVSGDVPLPLCNDEDQDVPHTCRTPEGTILQPSGPYAQPHNWHLLTVSYGGTVSLLKDLTRSECEAARNKIIIASVSGPIPPMGEASPHVAGDIKTVMCFQ